MHIRSTEEAQREHSGKQEGVRWELGDGIMGNEIRGNGIREWDQGDGI